MGRGVVDVYTKLFIKMSKLGFPDVYKGYKIVYYFKDLQADVKIFPTVKKIKIMWSLLDV